jgi:hypothetical protein
MRRLYFSGSPSNLPEDLLTKCGLVQARQDTVS